MLPSDEAALLSSSTARYEAPQEQQPVGGGDPSLCRPTSLSSSPVPIL